MAEITPKMGLMAWDQQLDPYNYQQLANNWNIMAFHDHTPGRGVPIPYGGLAAGAVDVPNLASGVMGTRGYFQDFTPRTYSSASYGLMNPADSVPGIELPAAGLIRVTYVGIWACSGASGYAAIFLTPSGSTAAQCRVMNNTTDTSASSQEVTVGAHANIKAPLMTSSTGLVTGAQTVNFGSFATAGQIVSATGTNGGSTIIFAESGSYTVDIRFKITGGTTVTVSSSQLWVDTLLFS